MYFIIYDKNEPQMKVSWSGTDVHSEWLTTKRHLKIPRYIYPECITQAGIARFCETRQPPRTRLNIEELLTTKYKMKTYLPVQMCMKSRGISHSDDLWLYFEGQELKRYEDISVR